MLIETAEGDMFLSRLVSECPICGKKFTRAIEHTYKTDNKKPICSYTCYMKYIRAEKKKFMDRHGDEFK